MLTGPMAAHVVLRPPPRPPPTAPLANRGRPFHLSTLGDRSCMFAVVGRSHLHQNRLQQQQIWTSRSAQVGVGGRSTVLPSRYAATIVSTRASAAAGQGSNPFGQQQGSGRSFDPWYEVLKAADYAVRETNAASRAFVVYARNALAQAQQGLSELDREHGFSGKGREAADAVSGSLEQLAQEASRAAVVLDSKYKVSEKAEEIGEAARQAALDLDCRFQIRQQVRRAQWEASYHWPRYQKLLVAFSHTVAFRILTFLLAAWLLVSGWLIHIMFWSAWVIPLFPLVARSLVKAALVEGKCPSCGHPFVGPRREKIACRQCKRVAWNPQKPDGKSSQKSRTAAAGDDGSTGQSSSSSDGGGGSWFGKRTKVTDRDPAEAPMIIDVEPL